MAQRSRIPTVGIAWGTRRMGAANGRGTVSFNTPGAFRAFRFSGTPAVTLTPLRGSSNFGRTVHLHVETLTSGSFTYFGSPSPGTFEWSAMRFPERQSRSWP